MGIKYGDVILAWSFFFVYQPKNDQAKMTSPYMIWSRHVLFNFASWANFRANIYFYWIGPQDADLTPTEKAELCQQLNVLTAKARNILSMEQSLIDDALLSCKVGWGIVEQLANLHPTISTQPFNKNKALILGEIWTSSFQLFLTKETCKEFIHYHRALIHDSCNHGSATVGESTQP